MCPRRHEHDSQMNLIAPSPERVTQLLAEWSQGNRRALRELTPLVYDDLRRLAHHYMGAQRPEHTLQATALVNEAYLRLADQTSPDFTNRSHFFAVAAQAMRQILVNYAKASRSQKRGGGACKIELDEAALVSPEQTAEILDLNEALERLGALDSRKARRGIEILRRPQSRRDRRSFENLSRDGST